MQASLPLLKPPARPPVATAAAVPPPLEQELLPPHPEAGGAAAGGDEGDLGAGPTPPKSRDPRGVLDRGSLWRLVKLDDEPVVFPAGW
jgi:hypothetical protein